MGKGAEGKVRDFAKLMSSLAEDIDRPVREIMEDVVRLTGLDRTLGDGDDSEDARANVGELISTAEEFDENALPEAATLGDYLSQVSLASDVDHLADGAGSVTLMTLHAAKGLEFPARLHRRVRRRPAAAGAGWRSGQCVAQSQQRADGRGTPPDIRRDNSRQRKN